MLTFLDKHKLLFITYSEVDKNIAKKMAIIRLL